MTSARTTPAASGVTARNTRKILWILIGLIVAVGVVWYATVTAPKPEASTALSTTDAHAVREDSHRLTNPATEKAVLVEFLDFECGPCRAAVPLIDELKRDYGDKITIVHRYFPLPGHRNSGTAALAVEAAAQQDKYEQMYLKLFDTQPQWANKNNSQAAVFRGYAQDLGLDMTRYDAAVADKRTQERIRQDVNDAKALGINGTPTFLLNGKTLTFSTKAQLRQLLEDALK